MATQPKKAENSAPSGKYFSVVLGDIGEDYVRKPDRASTNLVWENSRKKQLLVNLHTVTLPDSLLAPKKHSLLPHSEYGRS